MHQLAQSVSAKYHAGQLEDVHTELESMEKAYDKVTTVLAAYK